MLTKLFLGAAFLSLLVPVCSFAEQNIDPVATVAICSCCSGGTSLQDLSNGDSTLYACSSQQHPSPGDACSGYNPSTGDEEEGVLSLSCGSL